MTGTNSFSKDVNIQTINLKCARLGRNHKCDEKMSRPALAVPVHFNHLPFLGERRYFRWAKTSQIDLPKHLKGRSKANVHDAAENLRIETEVIDEEHLVVLRTRMNVDVVDARLIVHAV